MTVEPLFRELSFYARKRAQVPPIAVPPEFVTTRAPVGTWPTRFGAPGQTSRSNDPLVSDRWAVAWQSPLGEAAQPDTILVGADFVVVNGQSSRGIFSRNGQVLGSVRRGIDTGFLDSQAHRLLAEDASGGMFSYVLPTGTRDARLMLARPQDEFQRQLVQGPGVFALLSTKPSPLGPPPSSVLEIVRIRDWQEKSDLKILSGIEPLAGVVRESDGFMQAAAGPSGLVVATPDGIGWCDWLLQPLAEWRWSLHPQGLSVDDAGRAHLTYADGQESRFTIVPPDGAPSCDLALPWNSSLNWTPPLLAPNGFVFLTPPGHVQAINYDGRLLWNQTRAPETPNGTVSSNGLLLVSDDRLYAFTTDGQRHVLWQPPEPLMTPPILAGGRIHVASASTLYSLEPG